MARRRSLERCAFLALAVLGVLLSAPAARAASEEDRVADMAKKAMEDYDSLEFESARTTLTECVTRLRSAGLDNTALAAKVYTNLGIVYIAGFKDRGRGQQQFERALSIDPALRLDPTVATPELQETWDAAAKAARRRKPAPAAPQKAPDEALQHSAVDEVRPNQRVFVRARPTVNVSRATLFYRSPGQERYEAVTMGRSQKVPGDIVGEIPASATQDRTLQYYLEAYNERGAVVGRQGSAESPFIVTISGAAKQSPSQEDHEDPLAFARKSNEPAPFTPRIYVGIGIGTGIAGVLSDTPTEISWSYTPSTDRYDPARAAKGGFIWSGLGLQGEVGAFLYQGLSLGLVGRIEPYVNNNADSIANFSSSSPCMSGGMPSACFGQRGAVRFGALGQLKLRYQFRRTMMFRPYVHFGIGGGEWRGALNIDDTNTNPAHAPTDECSASYDRPKGTPKDCSSVGDSGYNVTRKNTGLNRVCPSEGPCIDSIRMGYAALSAGGGFYLGVPRVGLFVEGTMLMLVGGANFGFLIDAYLGPQVHF